VGLWLLWLLSLWLLSLASLVGDAVEAAVEALVVLLVGQHVRERELLVRAKAGERVVREDTLLLGREEGEAHLLCGLAEALQLSLGLRNEASERRCFVVLHVLGQVLGGGCAVVAEGHRLQAGRKQVDLVVGVVGRHDLANDHGGGHLVIV